MSEVETWWQLINTGGVIGVLLLAVWVGVTGKVWPKSTVERVLEESRAANEKTATIIASQLAETISNGVKEAVHEGIKTGLAEGYMKLANLKDK